MMFFVDDKVKDIYDVVYPYYIISKVLGFAAFPLHVPKTKNEFFKNFLLNFIFVIGVIFAYLFVLSVVNKEQKDYEASYLASFIIDITRSFLLAMVSINYFVGLLMNFILQRPIQNLLAKFASNDLLMENIGIGIDHRYQYKMIFVYLLAISGHSLFLITFTQTILMYQNLAFQVSERIVSYIAATVMYTIFIGQMILALMAIYTRFRSINEHIKKYFITDQRFIAVRSVEENNAELVRKLATIHDGLSEIVCQTNLCYAFQIMMNMISWFIYTIYGTFNFYRLILINFKGYELLGYANMMWIVYHAMYLSAVVIFSSLIKAEGKKTSILLHQAINLEWNSKIVREMRIFSQQLGHRQPIVTCGLFPFDWSLFYSSIGLCVTYLTIMIQLDSSYSNPQLNVTLPAT
uniref:Gustatory receptor n=1 Tax=Lutzomyia longipalpis TaxID=7200 RepID=A0A3F2ZDJ6_LUTLO